MARILVVDDEPGMRKSLAIMLRRDGYQVTETGSVAEAVGRLKGEPYHLVIADLMMEPLNGLDLLALVQEHRPRCPVIIVTAFGSPEARAQALRRGAVDFLEKPVPAPELLERIQRVLQDDGH
ncbi:MAG: response regulator [Candidatus Rokuibacteriota bacterium]